MRLLTKSAAISLLERWSPLKGEGEAVGKGAGIGLAVFAAGTEEAGTDRMLCFDLRASRWTVLRLTTTPISARAARIASHV